MAKKSKSINRYTAFDVVDIILLAIIAFIAFYPFWNVFMISLNEPTDTLTGGVTLWFREFTLENYRHIFSEDSFLRALLISVSRTLIGASTSVIFTAAFSYGISKKWLMGQKFFIALLVITMYVSGGLIPTFLNIRNLGLYQNYLVYIIPSLLNSYNVIIMMTYFRTLPAELEESVRIDGGNDLVIFFRIILPVSMPVVATIALFNAVGHWNSWYDTMLYGGRKLMTMQMFLVELIQDADQVRKLMSSGSSIAASLAKLGFKPNVESVKATAMMVTAIPIIMVYPFLQKYFVKGIMVGSLKG
ncbi:MAG: carbohydrate ABC transporter permease [Ruminococcaceae bacterium]|nr:carbohydrate ABC transporter permease [Oscillospiraceae bacterium]